MLCRRLHHDFSNRGTSGEEHMIKREIQQFSCDSLIALHNCHLFSWKRFLEQGLKELRSVGAHFRRFQYHAVARCNCGNHRSERELKRIVPGRQDQTHPSRFVTDTCPRAKKYERILESSRRHPLPQVPSCVLDFTGDLVNLAEPCFLRRLS